MARGGANPKKHNDHIEISRGIIRRQREHHMNTFTSLPQDPLKQMCVEEKPPPPPPPLYFIPSSSSAATTFLHPTTLPPRVPLELSALDMDALRSVVPPVTVVLEGRAICHRIRLHDHSGYGSFAAALRRMFVDVEGGEDTVGDGIQLGDAVPGHVVAYEDMEGDLLLAGDLNWKDFVRVAKRIRILPAKPRRRKNARASVAP